MMKRFLVLVAALILCVSAASAETAVAGKILDVPENCYVWMSNYTHVLTIENSEEKIKWLADTDLNQLGETYPDIDPAPCDPYTYFKFYTEAGLNGCGLMDVQGQVVIPAKYADTRGFNDRWTAGFLLKDGTKDDYDYSTYGLYVNESNKKYYQIETVEIYYRGKMVGSLPRAEWTDMMTYGDYIAVRDRKGNRSWYNKDFVRSESTNLSEFEYDYTNKVYIHTPTQQPAFTPGCTLSEDEVRQTVMLTPEDLLVDLQGNVLADLSGYFSVTMENDSPLIVVCNEEGKRGVADLTGKEVLPLIYESVHMDKQPVARGYVRAVKDGKDGFVNLSTGEEAGFEYEAYSGRTDGVFICMEGEKGITLVTAGAGALPETFQKVNSNNGFYALVTKEDGSVHVIGLKGEDVLPEDAVLNERTDVSFSSDGTLILLANYDEDGKRTYTLYTVDYDPS